MHKVTTEELCSCCHKNGKFSQLELAGIDHSPYMRDRVPILGLSFPLNPCNICFAITVSPFLLYVYLTYPQVCKAGMGILTFRQSTSREPPLSLPCLSVNFIHAFHKLVLLTSCSVRKRHLFRLHIKMSICFIS